MPEFSLASGATAGKFQLLNWRGILLSLVGAVLLSWPMIFTTVPLGYFDTFAYLGTGEGAVNLLLEKMIQPLAEQPDAGPTSIDSNSQAVGESGHADKAQRYRSITYSFYLYLTSKTPLGLFLSTVLQTAATLLILFAFVDSLSGAPRIKLAAAALFVGIATTLPWFASYAMPDILAAAIILYYALLAGRLDRLGIGWQLGFMTLATFAVASHYGHLPLAAGLIVVILVLRAWTRSFSVRCVVFSVSPLMIAVLINLFASAIALNELAIAPKRIPILLARSIDDGPAYWYLRDVCPEAPYTICKVLPVIPGDISTFLWSDNGIRRASREELDLIRAEEAEILWQAFRAYPLEQTFFFFRNTLQQVVQVGTGEIQPLISTSGKGPSALVTSADLVADYPALALFDIVTKAGTALGIGLLIALWLKGTLRRPETQIVAVCLLGLLGNALIFGGLSAPVDRYQSRVVWILPALAVLYWLQAQREASP